MQATGATFCDRMNENVLTASGGCLSCAAEDVSKADAQPGRKSAGGVLDKKEVLMKKTFIAFGITLALMTGSAWAGEPETPAAEEITEVTEISPAVEEITEVADISLPETEQPQEKELPAAGEIIENFEVIETRPYEAVDAQVVLFEHQKTGAKVMYIANDDTNRTFDLTFLTHAIDDTGLPHVFEHATLDGSEKYPSKTLFFNLIYQTYNTFMNAMTYNRMTTFPVASLSEDQLLKYADYYTDSCLHPLIMEDESIFREEAWRYRMADEESPLTIEGTVYSEMLGAVTTQTQAAGNFLADAFPGSWIRYESGGNPDVIPEMTYESLKAYHDLYYHPSNCIAYLYGDIEDYAAFLALLDEAFSPYEKKTFVVEDEQYEPLEESVENSWLFPVEAGSDVTYASSAYYGILLPGLADEDELMKIDLLASVLGAESSPLSQALQTALPYAQLNCYLEMSGPDPVLVFAADHVNEEDGETFRDVVDQELAELEKNGISRELAEAVESSRVLSSRLRREGTSVGVNLIAYLAYNYSLYEDAWSALTLEQYEEMLADWCLDGTFAELAGEYLTGDQLTVLSVTTPQPGGKEEKDAALAEKLEEVKAGMSDEEKADVIAASNAVDEMEDTSGLVRSIQAVTVDTLPEEIPQYEIIDETDETGLRHVETAVQVSEVGTVELFLDAKGLSVEDLRWMRLLTDLQGYIDSEKHSRQELAVAQEHYFYSGSVSCDILDENDAPHPYYTISWISLTDDLAQGYDLAYELAFEQALDEAHVSQVSDALQALLANQKMAITQSPYSVTIFKGFAKNNAVMALNDEVGNLNYYRFLQKTAEDLEKDPASVIEKLVNVRELLRSSGGAIAAYVGDEESFEANRALADDFFARFDTDETEAAVYDTGSYPDSYALIVDSAVSYNGYAADYETLGLDGYNAGIDVVTALVTDQFLYPMLRDQYGAYGAMNNALEDAGIFMFSYRDPNLTETFAVYEQLPDLLRQYPVDQEVINGYILSTYSGVALSSGELLDALNAVSDYLSGKDPARKLAWMEQIKSVTPETIESFADVYQALVEKGVLISAGGSGIIRANSELFDEIEAPFETAGGEEEITEAADMMDEAA